MVVSNTTWSSTRSSVYQLDAEFLKVKLSRWRRAVQAHFKETIVCEQKQKVNNEFKRIQNASVGAQLENVKAAESVSFAANWVDFQFDG